MAKSFQHQIQIQIQRSTDEGGDGAGDGDQGDRQADLAIQQLTTYASAETAMRKRGFSGFRESGDPATGTSTGPGPKCSGLSSVWTGERGGERAFVVCTAINFCCTRLAIYFARKMCQPYELPGNPFCLFAASWMGII